MTPRKPTDHERVTRFLESIPPESPEPPDMVEVAATLEGRVMETLGILESTGMPARDADEFIRDCVFNAWMGFDYDPA